MSLNRVLEYGNIFGLEISEFKALWRSEHSIFLFFFPLETFTVLSKFSPRDLFQNRGFHTTIGHIKYYLVKNIKPIVFWKFKFLTLIKVIQ